jgi:hypothetical protein
LEVEPVNSSPSTWRENVLRLQGRCENRNEPRHGARAIAHGVDIFLSDHVEGVIA